jgi:hypothetical protein
MLRVYDPARPKPTAVSSVSSPFVCIAPGVVLFRAVLAACSYSIRKAFLFTELCAYIFRQKVKWMNLFASLETFPGLHCNFLALWQHCVPLLCFAFFLLLTMGQNNFKKAISWQRKYLEYSNFKTEFRILWDSVVGIATGYGLDDRGIGVRFPVELKIVSSPRRPDRLWGPPSLLSNVYRG